MSRETEIWKIIDNGINESMFSQIDDVFTCDSCNESIHLPFYNLEIDQSSMQFCEKCFQKTNLIECFKVGEIDRTDVSPDVKPLNWPCIICKKMLGGGHKWKTLSFNYIQTADLCLDCFERDPQLANYKKATSQLFSDDRKIMVSERTDPIFVDISAVKNRQIHKILKDQVTEARAHEYVRLIDDSLVNLPDNFGSLKQWVLFTDVYEIPLVQACTALVVDCATDKSGQVASLVIDDHGRISIDIVFNSIREYETAYNQWTSDQDESQDEIFAEFEARLKKDYCWENEKIAKVCKEFSGFVRFRECLSIYYG
jgi:hypothetical protein